MLKGSSVFGMKCDSCNSYTTTFEDNKGEIELAKEPKYRPKKTSFRQMASFYREYQTRYIKYSIY